MDSSRRANPLSYTEIGKAIHEYIFVVNPFHSIHKSVQVCGPMVSINVGQSLLELSALIGLHLERILPISI